MSGLEGAIIEQAVQIGVQLAISYGPKILRWRISSKELETQLHFNVVINFYSRPDYQRVHLILSRELDKYRPKKEDESFLKQSNVLLFDSGIKYNYYLSIISEQDYAAVLDMLDIQPNIDLDLEEAFVNTSLRASAVRLFIWPSDLPRKITLDRFKILLEDVYRFYKRFDEQLRNYMKDGTLHDFETKLLLELKVESKMVEIIEHIMKTIPEKMRNRNFYLAFDKKSLTVLLDDSHVIDILVKCLGG